LIRTGGTCKLVLQVHLKSWPPTAFMATPCRQGSCTPFASNFAAPCRRMRRHSMQATSVQHGRHVFSIAWRTDLSRRHKGSRIGCDWMLGQSRLHLVPGLLLCYSPMKLQASFLHLPGAMSLRLTMGLGLTTNGKVVPQRQLPPWRTGS